MINIYIYEHGYKNKLIESYIDVSERHCTSFKKGMYIKVNGTKYEIYEVVYNFDTHSIELYVFRD